MKTIKCKDCGVTVETKSLNRKRCDVCTFKVQKNPKHNLTEDQQKQALKLAGKMYYEKLAKHIGCSRSSLSRFAREKGISLNHHAYKKDLVDKVIKFYEKHGKVETIKKFPNVNYRSIVEKYPHKLRCVKWTDDQFIELCKMAGLISFKDQAKFFNRPRANEGSIRSVIVKRFGIGLGQINGMIYEHGRHLVNEDCEFIERVMSTRVKNKRPKYFQKIYLWCLMEDHLKEETPQFVKQAIRAMAEFQRKIFGARTNKECKRKIMKMIMERGSYATSN